MGMPDCDRSSRTETALLSTEQPPAVIISAAQRSAAHDGCTSSSGAEVARPDVTAWDQAKAHVRKPVESESGKLDLISTLPQRK